MDIIRHGDRVITVKRIDDGVWARSEFPHPLVTLDYDIADKLIAVTVICPAGEGGVEDGHSSHQHRA